MIRDMTSFTFKNALSDKFCFHYYAYPVTQIFTMSIRFVMAALMDKFKIDTNNNSPMVKKTMTDTKKKIFDYFDKYTLLPKNITEIIIDEYYYTDDEKIIWCNKFVKHRKNVAFCSNIYSALSVVAHLLSFIIIIWINVDWINANNHTSWISFRSISLSMLFLHPATKFMSPFIIIELSNNGPISMILSYCITAICIFVIAIDFCAYLIFILPSIFYYMPLWLGYALLVCCGCIAENKIDSYDKNRKMIIWGIIGWVSLFIMYWTIVFASTSMACVYSKQIRGNAVWYKCLIASWKLPHCPNTNFMYIDWSDPRAIALLVSWLLF